MDPDNPAAWSNNGRVYLEIGQFEEALPYFQKAIELNLEFEDPYLSAGNCLGEMGRYDDALRLYEQALMHCQESYELWYSKAATLSNLERISESIAVCDHILTEHPRDHDATILRQDLLSECSCKGSCMVYSFDDGEMNSQNGCLYSWKGMLFITLAVDEVRGNDLEFNGHKVAGVYNNLI